MRLTSITSRLALAAFFTTAAVLSTTSCKPKNGSELQGIVGIGEDGKLRAFGLLPMRNLPAREFQATENAGAKHAMELATKAEFYGIVECTELNTGNAEDWMDVAEERAAQGDLAILPNRHLIVTGDNRDAFDGTLPCRIIGRFLATMPELDEVLGSVIDNPSSVGERQFRLAQTIFLSLRGPTSSTSDASVSPLLQRYLDIAAAHFGLGSIAADGMKANMMALDSIFNPCSTEPSSLSLPAAAAEWKKVNFACVSTTRQGSSDKVYRPGGADGRAYVEVRNFAAAELALVHLKVLKGAKALDKDLHHLINLLTSTADWSNIKKDSTFYPLATYLATKDGGNYDFDGTFADLDTAKAEGLTLAGDDTDESDFELYPSAEPGFALGGCTAKTGQQAKGAGSTCERKADTATATGTKAATPTTLLDPRGYADAATRDLAPFLTAQATRASGSTLDAYNQAGLSKESFDLAMAGREKLLKQDATTKTRALNERMKGLPEKEATALKAWLAGRNDADAAISKGLKSEFGEGAVRGRLASSAPTTFDGVSRSLEVQSALRNLKAGESTTKVGNKEFEYLGERKVSTGDYVALREKGTGAYHFVDKKGNTQSWEPVNAKTGDTRNVLAEKATAAFGTGTTVYHQEDSNRFQGVSGTGDATKRELGILDGSGNLSKYPTVQTGTGVNASVAIDFKNEEAQKTAVRQLGDTVETRRNQFSEAFLKDPKNAGVDQATVNGLFKMSNMGQLDPAIANDPTKFAASAKAAGLNDTQIAQLGYTPNGTGGAYIGDGTKLKNFNTAKTATYDPALNQDIGRMFTAEEQKTLGINPTNGNPDQALTQAMTDTGYGQNGVDLKNNEEQLTGTDAALFDTYTPPTNTPPPSGTGTGTGPAPTGNVATQTQAPTNDQLAGGPQDAGSPTDTFSDPLAGGDSSIALTGDKPLTQTQKCTMLPTDAERETCRRESAK